MTINELIERAHTQAKDMGWWDEPRNTGELLMLIVSECGEALEAHRSGRRADMTMRIQTSPYYGETEWFKDHVKDTFEDELADIVIRIADMMGGLGYVPDKNAKDPFSYSAEVYDQWMLPDNVGNMLWRCVSSLSGFDKAMNIHGYTTYGSLYHTPISTIDVWCKKHNIDLWRHIDLKLKYNKTRGIRHGKAY